MVGSYSKPCHPQMSLSLVVHNLHSSSEERIGITSCKIHLVHSQLQEVSESAKNIHCEITYSYPKVKLGLITLQKYWLLSHQILFRAGSSHIFNKDSYIRQLVSACRLCPSMRLALRRLISPVIAGRYLHTLTYILF